MKPVMGKIYKECLILIGISSSDKGGAFVVLG
jgi:hypothetical protein